MRSWEWLVMSRGVQNWCQRVRKMTLMMRTMMKSHAKSMFTLHWRTSHWRSITNVTRQWSAQRPSSGCKDSHATSACKRFKKWSLAQKYPSLWLTEPLSCQAGSRSKVSSPEDDKTTTMVEIYAALDLTVYCGYEEDLYWRDLDRLARLSPYSPCSETLNLWRS